MQTTRLRQPWPACLMACLALFGVMAPSGYAETRGYVISYFQIATHHDDRNCPNGGNGGFGEARERAFKIRGFSQDKIDELLNGSSLDLTTANVLMVAKRGVRNGKPANVHHYPESQPDPNLEIVAGPYGYGFDLDGKDGPKGFEDPETHLKGVDNELYRALGCFANYDISPPQRPFWEDSVWRSEFPTIAVPAWLFSITTDDFDSGGPATVTMHRALGRLRLNKQGEAMSNLTYVIDPNAPHYGTLQGIYRDGVFTSNTEGAEVKLDSHFPLYFNFELYDSQLRLRFADDGKASGYLGGYHPWRDYWLMIGVVSEMGMVDVTGGYYNLKKLADAYPDPKTGENTAISSAFQVNAVPAFIAQPDGTFIVGSRATE